jgi:hypothetical protein
MITLELDRNEAAAQQFCRLPSVTGTKSATQ